MWPRIQYRRLLIGLAVIIGIFCILVFVSPNSSPYDLVAQVQHTIFPGEAIGCFRYDPEQTHTLRDLSNFSIRKSKSIFFHETSCKHMRHGHIVIDARQACAVESAARANAHLDVYLTFSAPGLIQSSKSQSDRILDALQQYDNIHIAHLNFANYTKGTAMEEMYHSGKLDYSSFPISHASDILRYLTLYKYGGIYMDLDVVVVKSLEDLSPNFAGAETEWNVAAGVMSMDHQGAGHRYAAACLEDLRTHFNAHEWGNNGPMIITRLLRQLCHATFSKNMVNRTCEDFHVYAPFMFYPVPWLEWRLYFDNESIAKVFRMIKDSYALHVWNKHSAKMLLPVQSDTAYTIFAKKFCPKVFAECDEYF